MNSSNERAVEIVEHCIDMVENLDDGSGDKFSCGVQAAIEVLRDVLSQAEQGNV